MPFVKREVLDEFRRDSLESKIQFIKEAVEKQMDEALTVIATHEADAIVVNGDGKFFQATFSVNEGIVENVVVNDKAVPVIEDEAVDAEVANDLHTIVESLMAGKDVPRTQVRDLLELIKKEDTYWLGDVLKMLEESRSPGWRDAYIAGKDEIRKGLHGSLLKIESAVPKTRFAKLGSKLKDFEGELRESVEILGTVAQRIVDESGDLVFNNEEEGVTHHSLIAEARALRGLLCKAERLMRKTDLGRVAEQHDGLAERIKEMLVMTEHLKVRSQRAKED